MLGDDGQRSSQDAGFAPALTWPTSPRTGSASRPGSTSRPRREQCSCCSRWWRWWPRSMGRLLRADHLRVLARRRCGLSLRTSRSEHRCSASCSACRWPGPGPHQLPRARASLRSLVLLPLVLPPVVGGIALLYTFGRRGLLGETFEVLGHPDRLLHHRGGDGPDVRRPAVPRRQPRGRAAHRRAAVRGGRRHPRRRPDHGAAPGHAARWCCPAWSPAPCCPSPAALGEFGATITFAGSLQGVTRTLPLEIYLQRETDADAAVALSLVLVRASPCVVIGFARQGTEQPCDASSTTPPWPTADVDVAFDVADRARPSRCSGPTAPASRPSSRSSPGCCDPTAAGSSLDGRPLTEPGGQDRRAWTSRRTTGGIGAAGPGAPAVPAPHASWTTSRSGPAAPGSRRRAARETARALARRGRRRRPRRPAARPALRRAGPAGRRRPGPGRRPRAAAARRAHGRPRRRRRPRRCADACAGVLADRTAIIVTHDVLDALLLADRVVVIEGGRIVEEGPSAEVLAQPRSAFAARIAGLNLIAGTWRDDAVTHRRRAARRGPGRRAHAPATATASSRCSAPAPSRSSCSRRAAARATPSRSTVTDLEPHGDRIRVRAGELSADITPQAAADLGLAPGMTVIFTIKATEVSVYGT